ncbi:MAG: ATP-binding protein [Bacteroidales bacterium]|nr:ATP-binding protein [Bacteroidales bacterium]
MFTRDVIPALEKWKNSDNRKPLLMRGARQVGKTTVVNEFGKTFDNYLYFNLEREEHLRLFESSMPLNTLIEQLFLIHGVVRKQGSTLIFIDEIQNSPKTIGLLRYFYEEHPELHIITAGSLLESVVDVKMSFPVGRVQYLPMYPCSFREFVGALGKGNLLEMAADSRMVHVVHNELMALFNRYVLVGGMPAAVQQYVTNHDVLAIDDVYETLLQAYRDDVEKYVRSNKITTVVRFILENGWRLAAKTITLSGFANSAYKSREVGEAFQLLQKAMLLELVYPATNTTVPALPEIKRAPKLVWLDTGLVNYAAGVRTDIIGANDILDVWQGRIAEHVVAQELLTLNHRIGQRRAFWLKGTGGESAEVDFIWTMDSRVIPIEVKSGHNSHLRSIHSFIDSAPVNVAVRVWSGEFSVDDVCTVIKKKPFKLINLPFYMVGNLEQIVRQYL